MGIEQLNFLQQPNVILVHEISVSNVVFDYQSRLQYSLLSNPTQLPLATFSERPMGIVKSVMRQLTKLHRPFQIDVYNSQGELVITFKRKFTKVNSTVEIVIDGKVVGKSVERWHPIRRKYELYVINPETGEFVLFGKISTEFLSYNFPVQHAKSQEVLGSIDRKWKGLVKEFYTDSGWYDIKFGNLGLNERTILLGCAVSIDLDYFSRNTRDD